MDITQEEWQIIEPTLETLHNTFDRRLQTILKIISERYEIPQQDLQEIARDTLDMTNCPPCPMDNSTKEKTKPKKRAVAKSAYKQPCQATTTHGTPCSRHVFPPNKYCGNHYKFYGDDH